MIFGIDFDGTIVTHDFPEIGDPVPNALPVMKRLGYAGHHIILFTIRSGQTLDQAVGYLKNNDIDLYGVNVNPQQKSWSNSPKPYCHMYIDDAALGCPLVEGVHERPFVNWLTVERVLIKKGILND